MHRSLGPSAPPRYTTHSIRRTQLPTRRPQVSRRPTAPGARFRGGAPDPRGRGIPLALASVRPSALRPSASPRWPMMTANGCTTPPLARPMLARPPVRAPVLGGCIVRPPEPPNTHSHARTLARTLRSLRHSVDQVTLAHIAMAAAAAASSGAGLPPDRGRVCRRRCRRRGGRPAPLHAAAAIAI